MGCAGSKPHLLLSSNNHASNSPQKGFILFNANTIEYLKENEVDVKAKLIQRCENKLLKTISSSSSSSTSSKSLLGNAKKSLFSSNNNSSNNNTNANNENNNNNNKTDLPTSGSATATTNQDVKSKSIESAVDYVLKYAINDFDIEDFKSSNHLSMKQIRKDIMKKYNNRTSFSRLNNSTNNGTLSMNGTLGSKDQTLTLSRTSSSEMAFYKLALNTAIDEFGSYVQENFIVISEFKSKVKESSEEKSKVEKQTDGDNESALTAEEEALKLKEALELARQNFYKGKVSMVCLTKTGGYVVKEVKDQTSDNLAQIVNQDVLADLNVHVQSDSVNESVNTESKLVTPKINVEDMDKTLNASTNSAQQQQQVEQQEALNEYLRMKNDLPTLFNDTIELIANYTAKEGVFEKDQIEFTDKLADRLSKSKHAIGLLKSISESDYAQVDEKLVECIINLDYVNRDFKTFISLLVEQLESKPDGSKDNELINKNEVIKQHANEIDSLTSQLSVKLFSAKNLPHPNEANKSEISLVKEEINVQVKSQADQLPSQTSPAKNESDKAKAELGKLSPSKNIDIKKEIAFSILNVGEVLAKTIDYYSLDTNNEQDEELKELINISKNQASLEKKQADDKEEKIENVISKQQLLQVNTDLKKSEDDKTTSNSRTAESYTSSLSSPSISSSPLSGSGSISPAEPKEQAYESSATATAMSASAVSAQNTTATNGAHSFVNEQQVNNEINFLINEINETASRKENLIQTSNSSTGFDDNHQHYGKSSSSSSDILTNSQNDLLKAESDTTNVQQFLNDIIIESATQNESNVVFRNATTTAPTQSNTSETSKRMSLDEEFFYQIEEVDKKVKYMNETCSENEGDDDDDLDDENFDYDESVELENTNDERLFHPRTPAKIKSELRKNRTIDLHEEIKQISNVIQDLVQTINVRNNNSTSNTNVNTSNGTETESEVVLNADEHNNESFDINFVVNQIKNETHERKNSTDSNDTPKGKKASANTSLSNIPVRQRVLTKQKATSIEDEHQQQQSIELSNGETFKSVVNFESYVDFSSNQSTPETNSLNNSKNRSKFRSKLPVKK